MANSMVSFPPFKVSWGTVDNDLASLQALADEEKVSLPKYLLGMLKHAVKGDNLANVHFFQDGSGDTYNTDDLDRMHKEFEAESKAGLTTICNTKEESDEHFRKLREEIDAGKEID
jgi:hypothetical protein